MLADSGRGEPGSCCCFTCRVYALGTAGGAMLLLIVSNDHKIICPTVFSLVILRLFWRCAEMPA